MIKCPECGYSPVQKAGWSRVTRATERQLFRCGNCGRRWSPRDAETRQIVRKVVTT